MRTLRSLIQSGVAVATALWAGPMSAQNVTEVQISPPQVQLRLGDRTQVFATAYAAGGNVALGAVFRWQSSDTNVVRVIVDEQSTEIGTLVATGAGATVVFAVSGPGAGTRGFTTVTVTAPAPQPQPPPIAIVAPVVMDSVLSPTVAAASLRSAARVEVQRFGTPVSCASGALVGGGFVATSYQTIRGADRVTISLENGTVVQDPQVVSYNVANDVALLRIPASMGDSLRIGATVQDNQYAWAVSYPACQAVASTSRVRITGTTPTLRHSGNLPESGMGAALVSNNGELVGLVNGDRTVAAPYSRVQSALSDARNSPRPTSVVDVARAENHLYGSFAARSDAPGASARVSPLESWQWSTLAREAALPMTFTGPLGRYQVELLINGAVRASTIVRVTPGVSTQVTLAPPALAQTPATPQPATPAQPTPQPPPQQPASPPVATRRGGSAAVPIVIVALLGGGAAACFTVGPCKKADTTSNGGPGPGTTGTVSVSIPNP